jgi:hypothetical protein
VLVAEVLDIKPHPNANKLRGVRGVQRATTRQSRVLGSARGAASRRAHPGCARDPGRVFAGHDLQRDRDGPLRAGRRDLYPVTHR